MAKDETRRIPPPILRADWEAFAALQAMAGYAPSNQAYGVEVVGALRDRMEELQGEETRAYAAAAAARDQATASEWKFHNAMLNVKMQVAAQFGPDSNELASLGLKKKSDYKKPPRTRADDPPE
jgi:hypothetical protein